MGSNNKYLKSKDRMILEYVHGEGRPKYRKYEELDADTGRVEGEWRQYKNAFVGVAEELCGRTSLQRRYSEKQKPRMVDGRGGEGSGAKREAWKTVYGITDIDEQPLIRLRHLYGQKKAARRALDRARRSMEEYRYRKPDEDGGKKMIFKMARDRTEEGMDVNIGTGGSSRKVRKC